MVVKQWWLFLECSSQEIDRKTTIAWQPVECPNTEPYKEAVFLCVFPVSIIVLVDGYVLLKVNNKMLLVKITKTRESQRIAKGFFCSQQRKFSDLEKARKERGCNGLCCNKCYNMHWSFWLRPSDYVFKSWLAWPVQNMNPAMQELCKCVMLATLGWARKTLLSNPGTTNPQVPSRSVISSMLSMHVVFCCVIAEQKRAQNL